MSGLWRNTIDNPPVLLNEVTIARQNTNFLVKSILDAMIMSL